MNVVILRGNLGDDPKIRETGGGKVANLRLAVTSRFEDRDGKQQERTTWINVVAWKHLADVVDGASKGDGVFVRGELSVRKWDKRDETTEWITEIRALDVVLIARAPSRGRDRGATGRDDRRGGSTGRDDGARSRPAQRQDGPPRREPAQYDDSDVPF